MFKSCIILLWVTSTVKSNAGTVSVDRLWVLKRSTCLCGSSSCMRRVRSAECDVNVIYRLHCSNLSSYKCPNKKNTCQRLCMSVFMMIDVCEIWYYCRTCRWFSALFITGLRRLWLINTESEETVTTGPLSLIHPLTSYSLCPSFLLWYFLFSILLCFTAFFSSSLGFLSSLRP